MEKKPIIFTAITIIVLIIAMIISLVFVFNQKDTKVYNSKLEQAQKYVSKVDYKKAEAAYLEAIKIDPKQTKAYVELADVYMNNGKEDKAVAILNKAYKNVESTADKKEIRDKQKQIDIQIKNNMGVINNGGDYVTYKGKSYYWEYHENSFYYDDSQRKEDTALWGYRYSTAVNDLISVDENGNKKTIYSGYSEDGIWIYKDRIYINDWSNIEDDYLPKVVCMNLDGTDKKDVGMDEISAVCSAGILTTGHEPTVYLCNENSDIEDFDAFINFGYLISVDNDIVYFTSDDYNSKKTVFKSIDGNGENETTLAEIGYYENVSCVQVIDDYIYFQYGKTDKGGKIAKVKKDGTGFTDLEDNDTDEFTAYKSKDGTVTFKHGGALNRPFEEDDAVYVYTDQSSERKKLLSPSEYKDMGKDLQNITYSGDNLYFVVIKWDENEETIDGYSYCKKDLKTNKITTYFNIDVDWA